MVVSHGSRRSRSGRDSRQEDARNMPEAPVRRPSPLFSVGRGPQVEVHSVVSEDILIKFATTCRTVDDVVVLINSK